MHKQCPQYSVIYIRYIYLDGVLFGASYSHLIMLKILRTLVVEDFKASFQDLGLPMDVLSSNPS